MNSELSVSEIVKSQKLSFISSLNQKVADCSVNGKTIFKLSGGDPSHFPKELIVILEEIKREKKASFLNYSPIAGFDDLRTSLAYLAQERYCSSYSSENILVCSGGCSGLFLALKTILNIGDKVLIQDPCWEYLPRLIENCGGIPIRLHYFSELKEEENWDKLLVEIKKHIDSGVKVISLNSPLNPTGTVIPRSVLNKIIKLCDQHHVWFISDDVTIDFDYTDQERIKIDNRSNFISINSFSKNLGVTGLRFGYVLASNFFISHLKKTQLYTCMYPNSLIQKMMTIYLKDQGVRYFEFIKKITQEYKSHAQRYTELFSTIKELEVNQPKGGLFLFPKVCSSIPLDFNKLLENHQVAVAPGAAFGSTREHFFRIFLGAHPEEVIKATEAIKNYFLTFHC